MKISQIKREQYISSIEVLILRKEQLCKRDPSKRLTFRFLFKDGKSTIHAWAFAVHGQKLHTELQLSSKYMLKGSMNAKLKNKQYKKGSSHTTSKYDLYLNNVVHEIVKSPRRSSVAQLDDLIQIVQNIRIRKYGDHTVQNCFLNGGRLRLYLGCEVCTTSIREPDKNGKFYCTTCKKNSGEKTRKVCIVISDIKVSNSSGNNVEGLVCFDSEANKILQKCGSNFMHDGEARDTYQNAIRTKKFNFDLRFEKNGSLIIKNITESGIKPVEELDGLTNTLNFNENNSISTTNQNGYSFSAQLDEPLSSVIIQRPPEGFQRQRLENAMYPIVHSSPGLVLVINNVHVKGYKPRTGSEVDVKNIRSFFEQLNFTVYVHNDVETKEELQLKINKFKKNATKTNDDVSSIFVFVLSHGINMEFALSGPGTSPNTVNFYDSVVNCFSETSFPAFAGRPKLFFYVCCSAFKPTKYVSDKKHLLPAHHHIYTDMLVSYASAPGSGSLRDSLAGTYFVRALIEVWMKNAYATDVEAMMKMVQQKLQDFFRTAGFTLNQLPFYQISVTFPFIFSKDFYFPVQRLITDHPATLNL